MNHLVTEFAPKPDLAYPFKRGWSPEPGVPFEVAEGVFWLRQPLPIALDHINLWILRDGDGWTIVDSGYDHPTCKAVWEQVFKTFMAAESVKRIIVTHFHPDHIGLAAWLSLRCGCPVWITRGEFAHYHRILTRDKVAFRDEVELFITELGFDDAYKSTLASFFEVEDKPAKKRVQEQMCHFITENDTIFIDEAPWTVVVGNGHSPEHACLYCPEKNVLISGDQAIPRISSNVSVYPSNRHQDPLGDWLSSCAKLQKTIPNDTLILPSHQEPFVGIHDRMQQLIGDHHAQLNRLRLLMRQITTVAQARKVLFDRELSNIDIILASGETLSHINYLLHREEITLKHTDDGLAEYRLK